MLLAATIDCQITEQLRQCGCHRLERFGEDDLACWLLPDGRLVSEAEAVDWMRARLPEEP